MGTHLIRRAIVPVAAVAAIVAACALGGRAVTDMTREQGAASLRAAVLDAAMQCCAVEGSYPSSLAYLEEHYGLVVNRDDYAVTYESYAANVPPSVRVVPR